MPRRCSVPGCHSNYNTQANYTPAFLFPKDNERRKIWITAINRKDFSPGPSAVVCIQHFDERFIIRQDKFVQQDGSVLTVPRKKLGLTDEAYPTVFHNQPHYLSKKLPAVRKDPSERTADLVKRDNDKFAEWCESDKIDSFSNFKLVLKNKVDTPWLFMLQENAVFIYKLEIVKCPKVTVTLEILDNFFVKLYYDNVQIDAKNILGFVLGNELKVEKWSQLDCVLSFLNSYQAKEIDVEQKLTTVKLLINEIIESDLEGVYSTKVQFILDQLLLTFSKRKRYNSEIILWAAKLYFSYPAAYFMIRESGMLTLPHQSYLRNLTTALNFNAKKEFTNSHYKFLKQKANIIEEHEKIVVVLLDEIYINPLMDYKGGNVVGIADNFSDPVTASTVQTFMISSIFSKNKDVAALIPVKNMTSTQLHEYTQKVMDMLHSCGYTILCLISDNNRINRNMFSSMCNGHLTTFIKSPYDDTKKIFFLFDTPHIMKAIRNNWLNQTSTNQTFFYPDTTDIEKINTASLMHLKQIYDAEKNLTIKSAPKLTRKVLFPSSIEKQNVNHALSLCDPITSNEHPNIIFLRKFHRWITKWKEISDLSATDKALLSVPAKGGMLSRETEFALIHTTEALLNISKYMIENLKASYVLLGKLQTDSLEACFGQFRQMNGGNYNISFRQIIEADKKLKLLSLIKFYSKNIGDFSIKSFDYSDENSESVNPNCEQFADAVYPSDSVDISTTNKSVLIFIAGYVAFKVQNGIVCSDCISTLSSNDLLECESSSDELYKYMLLVNRGGLKWPKKFTFDIVLTAFKIFQVLISEQYENQFLKYANLKDVVQKLTMEKIIISNYICVNMCSCGVSSDVLVKKCVSVIANILINNYCKAKNDKLLKSKSSNKRKLSTLLASTSKVSPK